MDKVYGFIQGGMDNVHLLGKRS